MTYTVVLLDMTPPARADRLRALLPPDFVLTLTARSAATST